jgi:hypothetical protein
MRKRRVDQQGDIKYEIAWTTLAEYLTYLERRCVSQNVASFIGAPTVREYVIGLEDWPPTLDARAVERLGKSVHAGQLARFHGRESLPLCWTWVLQLRQFKPMAETSELPDHFGRAPLLGLFGDGRPRSS